MSIDAFAEMSTVPPCPKVPGNESSTDHPDDAHDERIPTIEGTIAMAASHFRFHQANPWAILGLVALLVALALAPPARAGVIDTGNGAGAWVNTFDQTAVQSGSTPAVINDTTTVNDTNYDMNGNASPGSVTASVNASASANPAAANLLQIQTSFSAPDPGRFSGPTSPGTSIQEEAYWGNVTATVHAPAGSPMPSSIRLEFQVNYAPSDIDAYQGGTRASYLSLTGSPVMLLPQAGSVLQDGEAPAQTQPNGSLTASAHLDVPLASTGVSTRTFAVGLTSLFPGIQSNTASSINDAMSVSLTGIDLPDGTSLTADGYTVSFHSAAGPIAFETVPEPATWTVWGVLAACGAWMH